MKIIKIYIKSYKNLIDFSINFNKKAKSALIIGDNGSGKTNFLEAISLIFVYIRELLINKIVNKKTNPPFTFKIVYEINRSLITIDSEQNIFINKEKVNQISFDILPREIIIYNSGDSKRIYELLSTKEILRQSFNRIINLDYTTQKQLVLTHYLNNTNYYAINEVHFYLQQAKISQLLKSSYNSITKTNVENFLEVFIDQQKLRRNKTYKLILTRSQLLDYTNKNSNLFDLVRSLEQMGIFSNFAKSRRDYLKIYFQFGQHIVEFSDFGEGQQLLMSLNSLVNKFSYKETLFLMDEPDAFIHPENLFKLISLIQDSKSQFLMTTHSPAIISRLENSEVIHFKVNNKYPEDNYIISNPINLNQQYGKKINYLFEDLMHFESHPSFVSNAIKDINHHIEKIEFMEARKKLADLEKILGSNDTDIISLYTRIILNESF